MKVYIVAITSGQYMFPVGNGKLYKSKSAAKKFCDQYNQKLPVATESKAKVLVADNWHEEMEDSE
ncbi:hypothetical protein [Enterococcus hirae]|uniref:hypothetical protein n=1 Tax=Enterococcus hirae TaxID=1354 RepID=UPI002003DCBE|nr:hypothetical protein [Enterococcus hirae]MCK6145683.1 hypothetical protein [Enterococcus hirae]MCK6173099.1 hypothetical protein [Enterococcus hirae]